MMQELSFDDVKVYSVSELTSQIRTLLEESFSYIWVEAEVSNVKIPRSGHMYFTLKDENAQLRAVMFNFYRQKMKFELKDGMSVLCFGRISVYERDGVYQLYVEQIQPKGIGALQLAFLQLKEKLEKQGFFRKELKKKIPFFPITVGVITSSTGAAIRDIIKVLRRRLPSVNILIYPVKVQGENSAEEISRAIYDMNEFFFDEVDVLIVGRGGGSIEDLWAFNEEIVAKAIFDSKIPVISAVGHEIDWTIADFVADLRAPTPSAAAELAVPDRGEMLVRLSHLINRLKRHLYHRFESARLRLNRISSSKAFLEPRYKLQQYMQRLDELIDRATILLTQRRDKTKLMLEHLAVKLEMLNPLRILRRGYSVVYRLKDNKVVSSISMVRKQESIRIVISDGEFRAVVLQKRKENDNDGQNGQGSLF